MSAKQLSGGDWTQNFRTSPVNAACGVLENIRHAAAGSAAERAALETRPPDPRKSDAAGADDGAPKNPPCAGCHKIMIRSLRVDNFDADGKGESSRRGYGGPPIDASVTLLTASRSPSGRAETGVCCAMRRSLRACHGKDDYVCAGPRVEYLIAFASIASSTAAKTTPWFSAIVLASS